MMTLTKEWGVARLLFIVLGVVVTLTAFDLVRLFLIAAVLAYLVSPAVAGLQRRLRGRRGPAVLIVVATLLAPIGFAVWLLINLVASDSVALAASGPALIADTLATVLGG